MYDRMAPGQVRTSVERHDARLVNHLVADDHEPGHLQDLGAAAVDVRKRRAEHAACDAPVVDREIARARKGRSVRCGAPGLGAPRPSSVIGGNRPSGGSTISDACLDACPRSSQCDGGVTAAPPGTTNSALSVSAAWRISASRSANCSSVRTAWRPSSAARSNGTSIIWPLGHIPWRSGSPPRRSMRRKGTGRGRGRLRSGRHWSGGDRPERRRDRQRTRTRKSIRSHP